MVGIIKKHALSNQILPNPTVKKKHTKKITSNKITKKKYKKFTLKFKQIGENNLEARNQNKAILIFR